MLTELEDGREMAFAAERRHGSARTAASPSQPAATAHSRVDQPRKRRLSPAERRELILAEAIRYFSDVGFGGSTRELAQRVGVKQPLLYRYLPSKDALIKQVYETVYVHRWGRDWDTLISDRRIPLRARLTRFYNAYAQVMFEPEWIRIYFFSGLKGLDINKRYIEFMEKHVLRKICEEIRHAYDLPSLQEVPVTRQELAAFWLFHGGVFYYGVRREVYRVPVHVDVEQLTELAEWYKQVTGLQIVGSRADIGSVALGTKENGYAIILLPGESIGEPERLQMHFTVADVDAEYERLKKLGVEFEPPENKRGVGVTPTRMIQWGTRSNSVRHWQMLSLLVECSSA